VRIGKAEFANDVHAVLEKVQQGFEVVIEQDHCPVAVIRSPGRSGRPIASAKASGLGVTLDAGFAQNVQDGIKAPNLNVS
jgi:antitoxin (DNA-binding transcriptional repressor) of toxin-antitoxin stability system